MAIAAPPGSRRLKKAGMKYQADAASINTAAAAGSA